MLYGAILLREQRFDEECWANDILNECYFDNRLWGYTIRIVEELQTHNPAVFTDGVLYNLMRMGIMDWTKNNMRMNQSTQAMRLATALASWIIWIANAGQINVSGIVLGQWSRC